MTARDRDFERIVRYARPVAIGSCVIVAFPFATRAAAAQLATKSAVAQSANSELIGDLYVRLLAIALPVTILALGSLVYAVARFRDAGAPTPPPEKPVLEVAWLVATIVALLVAGLWAYPVLATPYLSPELYEEGGGAESSPGGSEAVEIEVVASQWQWQFTYADANVTTRNELVVPADEDVRLVATSRDVIHAFAVPELGVKRDVLPGEETTIRTRVHETGTYRAQCTAFCGAGHAEMTATVTVVDRETYDAWLAARAGEDGVTEPPTPRDDPPPRRHIPISSAAAGTGNS